MASSSVQHQEIRAALERYSKDELVDLMEHLLRIYVLDEPVKLESAVSKPESIAELSGYSFAQLMTLLQSSLEVEELGKFRVTPYTVYVTIGEAEFDLNGPTPTLARAEAVQEEEDAEEDGDALTPAQRMDAVSSRPWRNDYVARAPKKAAAPSAETPSMADLFANDKAGARGYSLFQAPPELAEDPDEPPPIAEVAPGDVVTASASDTGASTDHARTAASREEAPALAAPPPLAKGDKQIDPSNRFASLDLD